MTVNAIPMAKQTKEEVVENDLGTTLKSSKITSEIDFLKRMKLKQQISKESGADASLKAIADFQSADDKRIQEVYAKLIEIYQKAEAEKAAAVRDPSTPRTDRNTRANIYSQFGYKSLYDIASIVSEIQRVRSENDDIMSSVKSILS